MRNLKNNFLKIELPLTGHLTSKLLNFLNYKNLLLSQSFSAKTPSQTPHT